MINNKLRIGNFTSSEIVALMSLGKRPMTAEELAARPKSGKGSKTTLVEDVTVMGAAALTYIKDKKRERKLGRCLDTESNARPLTWGKLLEKRAFDLLGLEYKLTSTETDVHPEIPYWSGSKDGLRFGEKKAVIDFKAPITLRSFCDYVECADMAEIRANHSDGESHYWQLVSNACINGCDHAELIIYMPYYSEIQAIRDLAQQQSSEDVYKYYWIGSSHDDDVPFIPDGCEAYKNLYVFPFEIPREDKELLKKRVIEAGKLLFECEDVSRLSAELITSIQKADLENSRHQTT